jgi:hypothetical protein
VVTVNLQAASGELCLRCLVGGVAGAACSYARTDSQHQQVIDESRASIEQRSGEDWSHKTMVLAFGTCARVANALPLPADRRRVISGIRLVLADPRLRAERTEYELRDFGIPRLVRCELCNGPF